MITRLATRSFASVIALLVIRSVLYGAPLPESIYFPGEAEANRNGNSQAVPFDFGPARFQQVYDASAFDSLAESGGGWLRQIIFRVDSSIGHPFIGTVENMQLILSTTSRGVDQLSPVFDENLGPDGIRVIGPGSVRLSGEPGLFTVLFDLPSQPFFYAPSKGNLLLDFRVSEGIGFEGVPPPQGIAVLDAFNTVGDPVSSVYGFGGGAGLPAIGQASTLGLATLFVVTPIPEPSSLILMGLGCVLLFGIVWKRRKRREMNPDITP